MPSRPTAVTDRSRPPTEGSSRPQLLTQLAEAVRSFGGTAVIALSSTAHPVLYVRHRGSVVPVVAIPGIRTGWQFIWGRTGWADSTQVETLAAYLADAGVPATPHAPPIPRPRIRPAARRPVLSKGA